MNIRHPLHTHKHTRNDQNVTDRWTYGRKDGHTNGRANSTSTTNIVCRGGITRLSTITVENRKKDENRKKRDKNRNKDKNRSSALPYAQLDFPKYRTVSMIPMKTKIKKIVIRWKYRETLRPQHGNQLQSSRTHTYIILTPFNPTFI